MRAVAHEHAARLEGAEEELVRIERNGIREADGRHGVPEPGAERGEGAVGAVHVQPQALFAAQRRDILDRIDGARGHRACVGDHTEGPQARRAVCREGLGERIEAEAEAGVGGQFAQVARAEPEHRYRLVDTGVRLLRGVEHQGRAAALQTVGAGAIAEGMVARGREPHEVRHGPAARHDAAGGGRQAEQPREPAHDRPLDRVGGGREVPEVAVLVDEGGRVVRVGGQVVGRGLHVGQEARMRRMRGVRDDHVLELREQVGERPARLGQGRFHERAQCLVVHERMDRARCEAGLVAAREAGEPGLGLLVAFGREEQRFHRRHDA